MQLSSRISFTYTQVMDAFQQTGMMRVYHRPIKRFACLLVLVLPWGLGVLPAQALDLRYRCQEAQEVVFGAAREAVQEMTAWRSIRIVEPKRTIRAVVPSWRNLRVPVWIQILPVAEKESNGRTELHVRWEQGMAPLNYPDLFPFFEAFWKKHDQLGLHCIRAETGIGL